MNSKYEVVIGLEVHAQLKTKSKIFCGCSTEFGAPPNSHVCPVCTGQPGVLPVLNKEVITLAVKMALATGCNLRRKSRFARKHYFYPDLPKGYQISQYEEPYAEAGGIDILLNGEKRRISLTRIHLEEDAGKNMHPLGQPVSLVDLNRTGVPLIEIVSEPDIRSPEEAAEYMRTLRGIVRTLGICDGNLEEGSLRCDANISLRKKGDPKLGTKVEIKNINSFKFVQRALEYEVERQTMLLDAGEKIIQETRLFNSDSGLTSSMRSKEEAHDYRYFPDPDLPIMHIDDDLIERLKGELPEIPLVRRERFKNEYGLSDYDAEVLTKEDQLSSYFEEVVRAGALPKRASNWIQTELLNRVSDVRFVFETKITPLILAQLLKLVEEEKINGRAGKEIFGILWTEGGNPEEIANKLGLFQIQDNGEIELFIKELIHKSPAQIEEYRAGKKQVLGYFVGLVMKETKGRGNPKLINELVVKYLEGKDS